MLLNVIHFIQDMDLSHSRFEDLGKKIDKMLKIVSDMLKNSIFSFSNEDAPMAYSILKEDDKVDELFHQIKVSLQKSFANEKLAEEDIRNIMNIDTISHNLERIGDSATNIAEATIYLVEGRDIRHGNNE